MVRQRDLRAEHLRCFTEKGVAQVTPSLLLGFAGRARVGAYIAGARIERNALFFAPRADEVFVTRGLRATELVVEVRAGNVIPLLAPPDTAASTGCFLSR